jgi:hypothetical protein
LPSPLIHCEKKKKSKKKQWRLPSKKKNRGKNLSPRNRKACYSVDTAVLKSVAEIGAPSAMKIHCDNELVWLLTECKVFVKRIWDIHLASNFSVLCFYAGTSLQIYGLVYVQEFCKTSNSFWRPRKANKDRYTAIAMVIEWEERRRLESNARKEASRE